MSATRPHGDVELVGRRAVIPHNETCQPVVNLARINDILPGVQIQIANRYHYVHTYSATLDTYEDARRLQFFKFPLNFFGPRGHLFLPPIEARDAAAGGDADERPEGYLKKPQRKTMKNRASAFGVFGGGPYVRHLRGIAMCPTKRRLLALALTRLRRISL